jgi:S-adenosylmethionine:tRNA ribosyltransferase-isomerase
VLDSRLPLPEKYELPARSAAAIERTKDSGGRIVAIGTTVTRALEGAAASLRGSLAGSSGITDLVLGPTTRRLVVDALLTGVHEPGTSHFALLESFAPRALLERAYAFAESHGYRGHEFGDLVLILPSTTQPARSNKIESRARRGSAVVAGLRSEGG